ncbi:hypothetical protein LSAT2_032914 [Lamellibrachia satsuma]|nr:hypothetical protein LSAT2_032914 [Lamellibrachia satsuma]
MTSDYRSNGDETSVYIGADGDFWFRGTQTFSGLLGVMLLVGVLANAYILWVTAQRRFPIRWETFRLILRYSSVVDLSMCVVLASVVLWPWVLYHTGNDVLVILECSRIDVDCVMLCSGCLVGSGIVVITRHANMLVTFDQEIGLCRQHSSRLKKLVMCVAVVCLVCFGASVLLKKTSPVFDLQLCLVACAASSRAVYLLLAPVAVNLALGIVVVMRASRQVTDVERPTRVDQDDSPICDNAKLIQQTSEYDGVPTEVSDSRWKQLVIVVNVAGLTWFITGTAMTLAGVLLDSVSVGTMFVLTGCFALTSAWNAIAIAKYWT